jgi:hypothetical protein
MFGGPCSRQIKTLGIAPEDTAHITASIVALHFEDMWGGGRAAGLITPLVSAHHQQTRRCEVVEGPGPNLSFSSLEVRICQHARPEAQAQYFGKSSTAIFLLVLTTTLGLLARASSHTAPSWSRFVMTCIQLSSVLPRSISI